MNALQDILMSIRQPNIWFVLGVQDYLRQFGRTVMGPVWALAQPGAWVFAIGFFFAPIMGDDIGKYVTHVAVGIAVFTFFSGSVVECGRSFLTHQGIIQNFSIPMFIHVLREATRNFCRLVAQLLIAGIAMLIYQQALGPIAFLAIFGLLINILASLVLSLGISMLTVRWGDIQFAIGAVMRLMFLVTPIIWSIENMSGTRAIVAQLNPIAHFIEIVRAPLLGGLPSPLSYAVTIGLTIFTAIAAFVIFNRKKNNIAIWAHT